MDLQEPELNQELLFSLKLLTRLHSFLKICIKKANPK
jgi:hypothetical protein